MPCFHCSILFFFAVFISFTHSSCAHEFEHGIMTFKIQAGTTNLQEVNFYILFQPECKFVCVS
jgi:hypothetical protein